MRKSVVACLGAVVLLAFVVTLPVASVDSASAATSTVASAEVIDYSGLTSTQIVKLVSLFRQQGISEMTLRLPAYSDFTGQCPSSAFVSAAKKIISEASKYGIKVNIDMHTWFSTWDTYFRDAAASHTTYRTKYVNYVKNTIAAFSGYSVAAWMLLNEPQARKATASENQFILDIISAAKSKTSKPVSVRFMGGYSPDTGYYSASIDGACGFLCRNVYWDPRNPSTSKYGVSSATMQRMISSAKSSGKPLYISEFGKSKSSLTEQANYVKAFVSYAKSSGISKVFCWDITPTSGSGDTYNIFGNNMVPNAAFYALK